MSQVSFEIESLEKDVEFMSETYLFTKYFCTDLDISYVFSLCFESLFSPCLPPFFEGMNTIHFSTCLTQHTGRAIKCRISPDWRTLVGGCLFGNTCLGPLLRFSTELDCSKYGGEPVGED